MRFSKDENFYQVSWISGPRHNFLAIAFAENDDRSEPQIQMLPPRGECRHTALKEDEILNFVQQGIAEANRAFKTNFRVNCIKYVENDTSPEKQYVMLAYRIIERLAAGDMF